MEEIKSPIFLEQFLEEKYHPNNLKDDFSSKKDAFIFTSMKPVIGQVKQHKMGFWKIEMNKPIPAPVYSIL